MQRTRECIVCGNDFTYNVGRGKDRKICGEGCIKVSAIRATSKKVESLSSTKCATDGCNNPVRRVGPGLCEACYMRKRRKGTTDKKTYPYRTAQSCGYIRLKEKDHPLSDTTGSVYEHRFVYHQYHGEGPFECHWCNTKVTWFDMHIDHLDDIVTNNEISNLVASCPLCNTKRGSYKMIKKRRDGGYMVTYKGETKCISEWVVVLKLGISRTSLMSRLASGWPVERAFTEPRGRTGPKATKHRNF